jgi:hypothetical protein
MKLTMGFSMLLCYLLSVTLRTIVLVLLCFYICKKKMQLSNASLHLC